MKVRGQGPCLRSGKAVPARRMHFSPHLHKSSMSLTLWAWHSKKGSAADSTRKTVGHEGRGREDWTLHMPVQLECGDDSPEVFSIFRVSGELETGGKGKACEFAPGDIIEVGSILGYVIDHRISHISCGSLPAARACGLCLKRVLMSFLPAGRQHNSL